MAKAKLSDADIRDIQQRAPTETYRSIADDYGISLSTVSYIHTKRMETSGIRSIDRDIVNIQGRLNQATNPKVKKAYRRLLSVLRSWRKIEEQTNGWN